MKQSLAHMALVVRDYEKMRTLGITFVRDPKEMDYGTVAVFLDLYENRWDLIQFTD